MNKKILILSIIFITMFSNFYCFFLSRDIKRSSRNLKNKKELLISTWNIQIFGKKKIFNVKIRNKIISIIKKFDIITIQEYRSKINYLNLFIINLNKKSKKKYKYLISKRLGRTKSKEQYIVIYDSNKIIIIKSEEYSDLNDEFERDPFIVYCKTLDNQFDFILVSIHTNPKKSIFEIQSCYNIITYLYINYKYEYDIIFIGDFNANNKQIQKAIDDISLIEINLGFAIKLPQKTNTRQTKLYDNIIYYPKTTKEFKKSYIFIPKDKKSFLKISDHLPIYALFTWKLDDD